MENEALGTEGIEKLTLCGGLRERTGPPSGWTGLGVGVWVLTMPLLPPLLPLQRQVSGAVRWGVLGLQEVTALRRAG